MRRIFCKNLLGSEQIQILFWDKNGFWLYYRRLENGHFNWPQIKDNGHTLAVSEQQLSWLLDGLQLVEKDAHKEVLMRKLI